MRDVLARLRRTAPRRLPRKAAGWLLRKGRARVRRWTMLRGAGELSDRALLAALGGGFGSVEAVLEHFVARTAPRFFVATGDAPVRAAAIAAAYPHLALRTRGAAERTLRHVVDLLGSGPVVLGPRIDWHVDFKTGIGWPRRALYEDIDYSRLTEPCDVKVPWELSRGYQLVGLGRAYALDRDPRYARELVAQLECWLDDNPWPLGVNWGRAMEVAVRAVNWLWAAALIDDAPELTAKTRVRLLKSLIQHGRFIRENLEDSDNNGNHYLSNGVGLVFLGILLPEVRDAREWRRKGFEIMWGEIRRQVYPDGVDFEKGIGYQGLVLELCYSVVRLCDLNGYAVPDDVCERVQRMCDFVLAYTRPDGTFPQIGDNDDGRLAGTDDEPIGTHRRHLAVGGALFGRADLLAAAGDAVETAVWLFDERLLAAPRETPVQRSQAFADGGFFVLRGDDAVMVVDAGEVGMRGIGGHGHNDVLAFDLWAGGASVLPDAGTYVYTADPAARQWFRGTAAHNTLQVDGAETARLGNASWLWRIEDDAHPRVLTWTTDDARDMLEAEHDGYGRLPLGVVHRRRITFDRRAFVWLVEDAVIGEGEHDLALWFHPAVPLALEPGGVARLIVPRGDLLLVPLAHPSGTRLEPVPAWLSKGYGYRQAATALRYAVRAEAPCRFRTALALVSRGTPADQVRSDLRQRFN